MGKALRKLSFEEAEKEDIAYWKSKTPEEKLDALQHLREIYYDLNNENRERFQRFYRIIKQASGRKQDLADIEKLEKI